MSTVGNTYLERGQPVTVLTAWRQQRVTETVHLPHLRTGTSTPRNVRVRRADGTEVVRPFRGLRKPKDNQ
jgi:acetyl esterase